MKFDELESFIAVASSGSVSKAAAEQFLTQPAITRRIQNLEAQVEQPLFDRVGKRMHLTPGGEALLPYAQRILDDRSQAQTALLNLRQSVGGRLRLATSHHIGLHRLAPVLRTFVSAFPDVRLDIRFEDSEAAHELVAQGETELGVVTLDPAGSDRLQSEPVWDDPLVFVSAAEHPLARSRAPLTLATIAGHQAVLPGLVTYTGRIVADLFAAEGLPLNTPMSTNYLETIGMLVAAGLGWSVLPRTMRTEGLVELDVPAVAIARTLGIVTNPARTQSAAGLAFAATLKRFADGAGNATTVTSSLPDKG